MIRLNTSALGSFYLIAATGLLNYNSPAVAERTAGCGSGASATLLEILSPVGSNQFRVACDEHDVCYDTLGKSRQECDAAFHNRMLGICARDHNTIFGIPLKKTCNGRADAYYAGVKKHGGIPIWNTGTDGSPGAFLAIQWDGNVVVYDRNEKPIWFTNTVGK